jgi:phospholipid transport system substrate-binding protein
MFCSRIVFMVLALVILPGTSAAQQDSPTAVVEHFQDILIEVMKNAQQWGYEGRYERLAPVVRQTHDLPIITRVAVGRYWRQFTEEQRASLVDTFSELSIATYAFRFDSYSDQTFKTLSEERIHNNEAVVQTLFIESDGDTRRFDYMLRRADENWRIVNIIVDGVSDLALKRAEYTSILRREGFDSLITKLEEKIAQYSQQGSS